MIAGSFADSAGRRPSWSQLIPAGKPVQCRLARLWMQAITHNYPPTSYSKSKPARPLLRYLMYSAYVMSLQAGAQPMA